MAVDKELEPVLIAFVKQSRLHFSSNTFKDILSSVGSRPVSIISIIHPNGEQKDQVFNSCLDYLETIDVNRSRSRRVWKSKSDTDAKGIYLCPEPIIVKKSCHEAAVILMEVNGNFDPKTALREDLMILALSCVLSSTLMITIESTFTKEMQEFLQMFDKYGKGGAGSEMSVSYLNLVLMVNNWKSSERYQFGYHDCATCPIKGKYLYNYRNERLDTKTHPDKHLEKEEAARNQFFVDSFQKVIFSLLPGKDSEMIDEFTPPPKFEDILRKTIIRLLHPSNLAIKHLGKQRLNGHQFVKLFEQISSLMAETDAETESEQQFKDHIKSAMKKMDAQVVDKDFNSKESGFDIEISQLFGINLDGLTGAVRSTIGIN